MAVHHSWEPICPDIRRHCKTTPQKCLFKPDTYLRAKKLAPSLVSFVLWIFLRVWKYPRRLLQKHRSTNDSAADHKRWELKIDLLWQHIWIPSITPWWIYSGINIKAGLLWLLWNNKTTDVHPYLPTPSLRLQKHRYRWTLKWPRQILLDKRKRMLKCQKSYWPSGCGL